MHYKPLTYKAHIRYYLYEGVFKVILNKIGKRLKSLRKQTGLSQEDFALRVGIDRTFYSKVENGKKNISILKLQNILNGLGISFKNFFNF